MKVSQLSGEHLGKVVSLETNGTTISGALQSVTHKTQLIDVRQFGDSGPRWEPSRVDSDVVITPDIRVTVRPENQVEIPGN